MAWETVSAENLIRHSGGTYYLNAKVRGKKIRRSLKTNSLKVAKIKRDEMLAGLRQSSVAEPSQVRTLGDALALVLARLVANPRSRPRTREHYREIAATLRKTLPVELVATLWTKDAASAWWRSYATRAASQANKGLSMAKKVAELLQEAGVRHDNPTAHLKRMREKSSAVDSLPSRARFLRVIVRIKWVGQPYSQESSEMVAFLAWSGLLLVGCCCCCCTGAKQVFKLKLYPSRACAPVFFSLRFDPFEEIRWKTDGNFCGGFWLLAVGIHGVAGSFNGSMTRHWAIIQYFSGLARCYWVFLGGNERNDHRHPTL